jgi:hypothetical protein
MAAAMNVETGKQIHPHEWTNYKIPDIYGTTLQEFFDAVIKHEALENSLPEEGMHDIMDTLIAHSVEPILVTHRGWHPKAEEITHQQMTNHWPQLQYRLICIEPHVRKAVLLKNLDIMPDVWLDDNADVIKECKYIFPDCSAHLIRMPHNRDHDPAIDLVGAHQIIYSHLIAKG